MELYTNEMCLIRFRENNYYSIQIRIIELYLCALQYCI